MHQLSYSSEIKIILLVSWDGCLHNGCTISSDGNRNIVTSKMHNKEAIIMVHCTLGDNMQSSCSTDRYTFS